VSWDCECQTGYSGESCDAGPMSSLKFSSLPLDRQEVIIIASQAMSMVYWTHPLKHCVGPAITEMTGPLRLGNDINSDAFGVASAVHPNGLPFMAFRGTSNFDDSFSDQVWQDAKFFAHQVTIGNHEASCTVGFCQAVMDNKEQLLSQARKVLGDRKTLLLTGHSLGAAIAGIFTAVLKAAMPDVTIKLVTFGGPRFGDARMARLVEHSAEYIYRIVNAQADDGTVHVDGVTTGPNWTNPPALRKWYQHVGTQITIGYDDNTFPLASGLSSFKYAVQLHQTKLYVERLIELAEKETKQTGKNPLAAQLCKKIINWK